MNRKESLGRLGEAAAEVHLEGLGFRILARRYACRLGEIDLVVEDGDCLCFVEVRTRRGGAIRPFETIGHRKQRRLVAAARDYLYCQRISDRALRFDVVEIEADRSGSLRVSLWKNAFEVSD